MWIPPEIWSLKDLSLTERVLLAEIASLERGKGCFASNRYFADLLGLSPDSVKKYLRRLSQAELVEITLKANERKITIRGGKNFPGGVKNFPEGVEDLPSKGVKNFPPTIYSVISIEDNKGEPAPAAPSVVFPFDSNEFKNTWKVWKDERKAQRVKAYTPRGEQAALHNLQNISNNDEQTALEIIKQSIAQGWRGLFPLKGASNPRKLAGEDLRAYIEG